MKNIGKIDKDVLYKKKKDDCSENENLSGQSSADGLVLAERWTYCWKKDPPVCFYIPAKYPEAFKSI